MKRIFSLLFICLLIAGCQTKTVRQTDLNSWTNHSVRELDHHPLFSTYPREKRDINEVEYILNFTEKKLIPVGHVSCFGLSSGIGFGGFGIGSGTSTCSNQQYIEDNCVHQFTIQNDVVVEYRVLGKNNCFTTCANTPRPEQFKK